MRDARFSPESIQDTTCWISVPVYFSSLVTRSAVGCGKTVTVRTGVLQTDTDLLQKVRRTTFRSKFDR